MGAVACAADTIPTQKPSEPTATPTEPTTTPDVSAEMTNLTTEHKSANGIATKDNGLMRENLTASQLMKLLN